MTSNNSSNGAFLSYGSSPGDSTSQSSGASTSPSSSTPYLVDIGGSGSSYSYLGGSGMQPQQSHCNQLQSIHHQQLQQQQWYNDQSSFGQNSLVDGYLSMEAGRAAVAAAAAHHNIYVPLAQPQPPVHQQGASTTPAGTGAAVAVAAPATRGKNKRKHAGVDKKVYQATMKPIIERQRRARINNSLEELHSLLRLLTGANLRPRQPISPGGNADPAAAAANASNNPRRIEKADILEQAVRFIKNLKSNGSIQVNTSNVPSPNSSNSNSSSATSNMPDSNNQSQQPQPHREPSPNSQQQPNGLQLAAIQQAFCAGYAECTRLTTTWLASHQEFEKGPSRHGGASHDDSHLSSNDHGEDRDTDSMADDDDGDAFLGTDDEEQDVKPGVGQQLRAKLEDHLISRLNERLTAHISKCLPPTAGRMQGGQLIPTPPQSPKDLLLPFLTNGAAVAVGPNGVPSSNVAYPHNLQQFSPISPFTAAAQQQMQQQQQNAQQQPVQTASSSNGQCSGNQQQPTTVIYYDPMTQQQPSTSATGQGVAQQSAASSSNGLTPLMAEFMDTKDPVAFNNAMMFNSFVAQLQQTQRAAAAAGLYCWRPWD